MAGFRTALLLGAMFCATLTGCRLEFAADAGTFAPSVREVSRLLEQDRVRLALERAELLTQRYRGVEAEVAHGWALWRNGDARAAEARFRRAADAGSREGYAGLAALLASSADWSEAEDMARRAVAGDARPGAALAVLAARAWVAGDAAAAARSLREWSSVEPGTARGRAAAAMAASVERIGGAPQRWDGGPSVIDLQGGVDAPWIVPAEIDGRTLRLRLDLTFRQSVIGAAMLAQLGLPSDGPAQPGRAPTARWPGLLSPRQAMVPRIDFGTMSLHDTVVAVVEAPAGVDGVLGADILGSVRWSLSIPRRQLVLAPPESGHARLPQIDEGRVVAWLTGRLAREGPTAQLLFFPRVAERVIAAGIDLNATSRLDMRSFVVPPGDSSAPARLMLGGWREDVAWRPASLTGWAVDGGVAPRAILGDNVLQAWALHWYPQSMQLRVDSPADGSRAGRR